MENQEIPVIDLTDRSLSEADYLMQEWAYDTFDKPDMPMSEFRMVKLAEGYNGFFLHIDHRLADSCALIILINDIMQLYCHLKFGAPYPKELASFEKMLEKDIAKANNPKRFAKDVDFWKECLIKYGEPLYSDIRGKGVLERSRKLYGNEALRAADLVKDDLSVGVRDFVLEKEAAVEMFDFCQTHQISVNNLLILGIRTYLSKMNEGQEDISVRSFISRRSTKDEWTSGGSRTVAFPCRTVISPDIEFLTAVRIVQEVQNNIYLHSNYDTALLDRQIREMFPHPAMTCYESVWLTYQPMPVKIDNPYIKDLPVRSRWYPNGVAVKKIYLTVSHKADGSMNFSFHYQTAIHTGHEMEIFYYYLMRIIFKGIEESDMTIGNIIETV